MRRFEQYEKIVRLVNTIDRAIEVRNEQGLDDAIANLTDKNELEYDDVQTLEDCLEIVEMIYHEEGAKREKPSVNAYVVRRLYTTTPVMAFSFLTLMLMMPFVFNISSFPGNLFAAITPIAIPLIARFIDKYYIGDEICRINSQGIFTDEKYLECDESIRSTADFIRWKDIDSWQFKYTKLLIEPHPVLYIKSPRYPNQMICINHFHKYGLKTLKAYSPKQFKGA